MSLKELSRKKIKGRTGGQASSARRQRSVNVRISGGALSPGVAIVDTKLCNLNSIYRALSHAGATPSVVKSAADLRHADRIVLPGVGSFGAAMHGLDAFGMVDELKHAADFRQVPVLGVCLGMQVLADVGVEGSPTIGLGLVPGEVRKIIPNSGVDRVPHVGWNEAHPVGAHHLFAGLPPKADFYFTHSYIFAPRVEEHICATTPYCGEFASVIAKDNVMGTQFHPEKSGKWGVRLLENFLKI